jgi:hypothetical protein
MANKYKNEFEKMVEENPDLIGFVKLKINSDNIGGEIIEVLPSKELVDFSNIIATEKASKTMSANQNLNSRSKEVQISNLCRGILGEAALQLFLISQIKTAAADVERFDLERETFDYVPVEYDLKYKNKRIEVRTSNNKFDALEKYVNSNENGVICKYINNLKKNEKDADYYFAIVYDYPGEKGSISDQKRISFVSDIINKKIKMYIITGANLSESKKYGVFKNLGQYNTKYLIINFSNCRNIFQVLDEIKKI